MRININREPEKVQFVSAKGEWFSSERSDARLLFEKTGLGMKLILKSSAALSFVKLRWNGSFEPGTKIFGDSFERAYGELEFRGIVPERLMAWYFSAEYPSGGATGCGVRVRPECFCFWQADNAGVTLWLDVRCGSSDCEFFGESITLAETVCLQSDKDGYAILHELCRALSDSPVFPDEPVYGSNNWYYAYGNSSHESIVSDTGLLCRLTEGLENRPYMVIDDGWQLGSTSGQCTGTAGTLTNEKFPDMKALAREITEKGAKPGLWLRPLKFNPENFDESIASARDALYMDPSCDETLEIIARDVRTVTGEWGFRLVKYDFATFDILGKFFPQNTLDITDGDWRLKHNMTNAQAVKRLYRTIFENSCGAVLIGCNCIPHLGSGYFHIHRSGDDTSGFYWERTRKYGINTLAYRMPQHKTFFDIDADCAGILEKNIDWRLNSQWLELLSKSGTPLFVSAQPSAVTPAMEAELKKAFALASRQQTHCVPADTSTVCPQTWVIDGMKTEFDFTDTMGSDKFRV